VTARRHRPIAIALLVGAAGCLPARAPLTPSGPPERPGTALILRGTALDAADARQDAVGFVGGATGRPVRLLANEPAVERVAKAAAERFEGDVARAARADARDAACRRKARSIATAVAERADVIVRLAIDARTTARAASAAERRELRESRLALPSSGDTLYETTFDGTVERTTFPGRVTTVRQKVRWTDRQLGSSDAPPTPRMRKALAAAFALLPEPAAARWDAVARALVTGGCPVLGDAVAETFIDDVPARRRVRAAAIGVLHSASPRAPSPTSTESPTVDLQRSPTCEPTDVARKE
jgi:hypothetical protein